jgi:predicted HAD superfamily Cof-like phosphohydrolase
MDLLNEEFKELEEALEEQDVVKVLDALLDIQYVLDGALLAWGLYKLKHRGFAEVHRSNMSKAGEDGKPIYREDGKILKGPNYTPPDLKSLIDGAFQQEVD